jgi:hypothetical protein
MNLNFTPRILNQKQSAYYLGMSVNTFKDDVRPDLTPVPMEGRQIKYDRLDLDAWLDEYKSRNALSNTKGEDQWERRQDSTCEAKSGISTNASSESTSGNQPGLAIVKKRN